MFPENYSILISGDPSSGMFEFCCYIASTYLRAGESLVFAEADTSPEQVREQLRAFGLDPDAHEADGRLVIRDCYSSDEAAPKQYDLADIGSVLSYVSSGLDELNPGPARVMFDSLTPLFLHHDTPTVGKFLRELSARSKTRGTLTCTVHRGIVREEQIELLSSISDGYMEMRADDSFRRFVRIKHMRGLQIAPRWVPFDFEQVEEEDGRGTFLSWRRE